MKLVSFELSGKQSVGALVGDQVANLSQAGFPATMRQFIERWTQTPCKAENVMTLRVPVARAHPR